MATKDRTATKDEAVAVPEEAPAAVSAAVEEVPPAIVPDAPKVTIEMFARTVKNKGLVSAFIHCEKLTSGTRKMSMDAWKAEYDKWLATERV